ncbi:MAG: hypothetical protein U0Z44_16770 [Kouleothrix sp.]
MGRRRNLGKGALIGLNGDAIHSSACLLGDFANQSARRSAAAWPGFRSTYQARGARQHDRHPLAHKDALYVRGNYGDHPFTCPTRRTPTSWR